MAMKEVLMRMSLKLLTMKKFGAAIASAASSRTKKIRSEAWRLRSVYMRSRPSTAAGRDHDRVWASPSLEARDDASGAHDQNPVGHAEHFGQIGGNHEHADAPPQQIVDEPVNLRLCANINTLRRFVEDQEFGTDGEPFAENDLLLIAA
jgi:hypothetical protein